MKKQALLLLLCFGLIVFSGGSLVGAFGQDAQANPELAEADRLNAEVIKLFKERRYADAEASAKRVVEVREKVLGLDHERVGTALYNLANIYWMEKKISDAERIFQRVLEIYEKAYGQEDVRLCRVLESMALAVFSGGSASKAEKLFLRTVAIREKTQGRNNPENAKTLQNLAQLKQEQADYKKAIAYYRQAIEITEAVYSKNDKRVGELLDQCACAHNQNNETKEAGELRVRAGEILGREWVDSQFVDGLLRGNAVERVTPEYPPDAKNLRVFGNVVVELKIGEKGEVLDVKALCGPALLLDTTVQAARKWRFNPTTINGKPVPVIGVLTFRFSL